MILLNPPINQTASGLRHVRERHTESGIARFAHKSKFHRGEDVSALIAAATHHRVILQPNGRLARTYDTGRIIGYDSTAGRQTTVVTVVTDQSGDLVTAFPGEP